jgi:lysophospholipase L1-like esterase
LNQALTNATKGFHVEIADGYGQFQLAAEQGGGNLCTASLLTALSGDDAGTCGVHPSIAGQALLAQAVEQAIKQ